MSKPRKHLAAQKDGEPLCGRFVLDRTTITNVLQDVTCPQCRAYIDPLPSVPPAGPVDEAGR